MQLASVGTLWSESRRECQWYVVIGSLAGEGREGILYLGGLQHVYY